MKTLHLVNKLEVGGVEVGILSLLSIENSEFFVAPIKGVDDNFIDSLTEEAKSRIIISSNIFNLAVKCIKLKPSILVSSLWRAHLFRMILSIFTSGVRQVHFVHNSRFAHFVDMLATKISFRLCDKVFSDSQMTLEWVKNQGCNKKTSIIPMNVSFLPEKVFVDKRKYSDIASKKIQFVFVGRYCEQKNFDVAFKFLKALKANGCTFKYDLYGRDDNYIDRLLKKIKQYGLEEDVEINGVLSPVEVENRLSNYDFYLQSSSAEGMAISVFQSIKSGIIPVVTPVGEIDRYTKDGHNAFHLNHSNVDYLAQKFCEQDFISYNIGEVVNENNYPTFNKVYFKEVSLI